MTEEEMKKCIDALGTAQRVLIHPLGVNPDDEKQREYFRGVAKALADLEYELQKEESAAKKLEDIRHSAGVWAYGYGLGVGKAEMEGDDETAQAELEGWQRVAATLEVVVGMSREKLDKEFARGRAVYQEKEK